LRCREGGPQQGKGIVPTRMALGLSVGEEGGHGPEDDQAIGKWGGRESVMVPPPQGAATPVDGVGQQVGQHEAVGGIACRDERHQIGSAERTCARCRGPPVSSDGDRPRKHSRRVRCNGKSTATRS
jgi:hypothetical protein